MENNLFQSASEFFELLPKALEQVREAIPEAPWPTLDKSKAARFLGISRKTLDCYLDQEKFGLKKELGSNEIRVDILRNAYVMINGKTAAREAALKQKGLRKAV